MIIQLYIILIHHFGELQSEKLDHLSVIIKIVGATENTWATENT